MATMETSAEVAEEVKEEAAEAELLEWTESSTVAELVDDGFVNLVAINIYYRLLTSIALIFSVNIFTSP